MKILSLNARCWYRDTDKHKPGYWKHRAERIRQLIDTEDPDIILFQEMLYPMTRCIPKRYKKACKGSISHHIYIRKAYKVLRHDWHIRYCHALIDTGTEGVNAFSIHTHWEEKIYRKTCTQITSELQACALTVAGGDWNNAPDTLRHLLFPLYLRTTGINTFRNWESGKEAELDYFAVWPDRNVKAVCHDQLFAISDHCPIILTDK